MSTIDLECRRSFSLPPHGALSRENKGILSVGCGHQTFLFPELPPCIGLRSLKQARLVLYKVPPGEADGHLGCGHGPYCAYPLLDFFSVYGYLYSPPRIDVELEAPFGIEADRCVTEVDVTRIASAWLAGTLENKGLFLVGSRNTRRVDHASDRYDAVGMRPMLRLVCEDVTICQPLSVICCTVTLNGGRGAC
jgi:hypothetical protein